MPDERGDVADAQLAARQRIQNADAGRIAEDAERVGERLDRPRRHQQPTPLLARADVRSPRRSRLQPKRLRMSLNLMGWAIS